MAINWKDIFKDEDEITSKPQEPTVQLPKENEKAGEDNGQGSPAAGALPEEGKPAGVKDVPEGTDEITGEELASFDDVFAFLNEEKEGEEGEEKKEGEDKPEEEQQDPEEEEEEEGSDDDGAEKGAKGRCGKKSKKRRKNIFSIFDKDPDEEGSDDDGATEKDPVKAPEGEEKKGGEEGTKKEDDDEKADAEEIADFLNF